MSPFAKGCNFRFQRCNLAGAFGTQENSEHAGYPDSGLRGEYSPFLLIHQDQIGLQLDCQRNRLSLAEV